MSNTTDNYHGLEDGDGFRAHIKDIDLFKGGNVRKKRDPQKFKELCASVVKTKGVTQGVTVRRNPSNHGRLELLAGFGRFEAAKLGGFDVIPAVFKEATDKEALAIMLEENGKREDLPIADEIRAAQDFVSLYDGDYKAAANDLGWPIEKLRRRIVLNKCTDSVIDALREQTIALGHAEILSTYTEKLQNGTLENIITENWSVEYLKQRAGRATRPLSNAIFDVSACGDCPHNSAIQASLFDNTIGNNKCSNLICFRKKTDSRLGELKAELSESHENVFLNIEKPDSDRNTVSAKVVGGPQFESGCTGCTKNSVILLDGINEDAGTVVTNQCIDAECFRRMVSDHTGAPTGKASKKKKSTKRKSVKKKVTTKKRVTQSTPVAVTQLNRLSLHTLSAVHFKDDNHLRECLFIATTAIRLGSSKVRDLGTIWKPSMSLQGDVMDLYSKPPKELESIKQSLFELYIKASSTPATEVCDMMISATANDERAASKAIETWKPTKELLNSYLLGGVVSIAKKSGFQRHYDKLEGKGAFNKVAKRKSDLVTTLLRVEFDWSSYAPDDYRNLLNNKQSGKKS